MEMGKRISKATSRPIFLLQSTLSHFMVYTNRQPFSGVYGQSLDQACFLR